MLAFRYVGIEIGNLLPDLRLCPSLARLTGLGMFVDCRESK